MDKGGKCKVARQRKFDYKKIIKDYEKGLGVSDLAIKHGISDSSIRHIINSHTNDYAKRYVKTKRKSKDLIPDYICERIFTDYMDGDLSQNEIAKKYEISSNGVRGILERVSKKHGMHSEYKKKTSSRSSCGKKRIYTDDIVKLLKKGYSRDQIKIKLKINSCLWNHKLHEIKHKMGTDWPPIVFCKYGYTEELKTILKLWKQGRSCSVIAIKTGVNVNFIRKVTQKSINSGFIRDSKVKRTKFDYYKAFDLYKKGVDFNKIALKMGVTAQSIRSAVQKIEGISYKRKKLKNVDVKSLKKDRNKGMKYKDIAQKYKISVSTAYVYINDK